MSHENFCLHLTLLKMFYLSRKNALIYMDSWFLMISKTNDFLQLEVNLLEEIISRSSLLVTTENEVFFAVTKWINHDFIEREKFAKRLLHKIRLPLLAERTLKTTLTEENCFRENKESLAVVNDILKGNFDFYINKPSKFFTARYCGHDSFDILYLGGYEKTNFGCITLNDKILQVHYTDDFNSSEVTSSLIKRPYNSEVVYLKGNVYIFGFVKEVEMYNHLTKTCKVVANIEDINDQDLTCYAVCGFMDKVYLIGGFDIENHDLDSCIEFDTKNFSWKHKSEMIERRQHPAACVFEEKIIVSGGLKDRGDDFVNFANFYDDEDLKTSNTVEAYNPTVDTWTEFPAMNYSRCQHKSVVVKNKLFVLAGGSDINEVYDSSSKKFTVLKPSLGLYNMRENCIFAAFKVSHKLFIFFSCSTNVFCFDTRKGKWCKRPKVAEHLTMFSAIHVPRV